MRHWTKSLCSSTCLIFSLSFSLAPVALAADAPPPARPAEVIATVNGEPIYVTEVEPRVAMKLYQLEIDRYTLLRTQVDEVIARHLLEAEARDRGMTVDALLDAEVAQKVPPFDEGAVDAYLAAHPDEAARVEAQPELRERLATWLDERRVHQRRLEFIAELKAASEITIAITPPQPPRQQLALPNAPVRGSATADVTIVHFASFTCPRCAHSVQDLQRLLQEFPGRIRWVHGTFFNMLDARALAAAEWGCYAQDMGRFWELHDRLYAAQGEIGAEDLPRLAEEAGLPAEDFARARREGRYLERIKRDLDAAQRAGVRALPTVFVNGRYFSPTFGYEALKDLVEEELAALDP